MKRAKKCGVQKLKKRKDFTLKFLRIFPVFTLLILLAGCAAVPVYEDISYFSFLSSDNDIYISLNVQKNRTILSAMLKKMSPEMKDSEINHILDRTRNLYVGIILDDTNENQSIELCAEGNFPPLITSAFTRNKGWTKEKLIFPDAAGKMIKQTAYVHSSGISLALPNSSIIFLSSNTIEPMLTSFYNPPPSDWPQYAVDAVTNKDDDAKIRSYVPDPGVLLPKIIGLGVQLALEDATAVASEVYIPGKPAQFSADIDLYFKDVRAVKASAALLKLASMGSQIEIVQKADTHLSLQGVVLSLDTLLGMKF